MDKKNEIEFDLIDLLLYMKKRLWIIILAVAVFTVAGYVGSKVLLTPEYTATARVYVVYNGENADDDKLDEAYTQQLMAGQLRNDFVVLFNDVMVTEKVVKNLELKTSAAGLSNRITVEAEDNTRILNLSITDTNPRRAAQVLNEVCNVGKAEIEAIMGGETVINIVHYAEVPGSPSSPSPKRNATVAAILGLVIAVSVMVVVFLMDDSIRNETDMEHYLGLSTLAEIPVSAELGQGKKGIDNRKSQSAFRGKRT